MDGVERVMVLGILAVIVAILSFAWGATDDGALAHDGVADGGTSTSGVSLSSNTPVGPPGVVVHPPKDPIDERRAAQGNLREFQQSLLGGQPSDVPSPILDVATYRPAERASEPRISPQPGAAAPEQGETPRVRPVVPQGEVVEAPASEPPSLRAEQAARPSFKLYTVQPGDTLWQIAYREVDQGGDTGRIVDLIHALNPTIDASDLQIDQTIKLPVELPQGVASKDLEHRATEHKARVYTISAGDTLRSIAQVQLGDSARWKEIYRLNPNTIREPGKIRVGLRILVPEQ